MVTWTRLYTYRWHDDKAHGWGMKAFANGDRHEGEYCLDLRQGCGTYHWANGDCYEGDWEVRALFLLLLLVLLLLWLVTLVVISF